MAQTPPVISWINHLATAETVTVSSESEDGVGLNAVDSLTYDYWIPEASNSTIEFQMTEPVLVECFGVAAHTIGSGGSKVQLEYWTGTEWSPISRPVISSRDVTLFEVLGAPVTADLFRVLVTEPCSVGVLWAGPVLEMQRTIYQGHTPVTLAERNSQRSNQTETGEWRSVATTVQGAELSADFKNLSAGWVRTYLASFITHVNDGGSFFWSWYRGKYHTEVAYCWNSGGDLQATNSGPRDLMSLTIQASAYLDGPPEFNDIYPYDGIWNYRTVEDSNPKEPIEFSQVDYDDSDWLRGPGGFGSFDPGGGLGVGTLINPDQGKAIWLRKTIEISSPQSVDEIFIDIWHDDGRWVWWNGEELSPVQQPNYYHSTLSIPPEKVLSTNVIAVQVIDGVPTGSPINIFAGLDIQVRYRS